MANRSTIYDNVSTIVDLATANTYFANGVVKLRAFGDVATAQPTVVLLDNSGNLSNEEFVLEEGGNYWDAAPDDPFKIIIKAASAGVTVEATI